MKLFTAALMAGSTMLGGAVAGFGEIAIEQDLAGRLMPRATSTNLQTFTGALGGIVADPITSSGDSSRPFEVSGSTFTDLKSASDRSCSNQHNSCAQAANKGDGSFKVSDCDAQQTSCLAALSSTTQTAFPTLFSTNADFDFFCDP